MSKVCKHLKEVGCIKDVCTCNTVPIEKAAERLYPINNTGGYMEMLSRHQLNNALKQEGFINGAKWMQERMYSLEQISKDFVGEEKSGGYFDDFLDYRINNPRIQITFKEWFEQLKKITCTLESV